MDEEFPAKETSCDSKQLSDYDIASYIMLGWYLTRRKNGSYIFIPSA